MKVTVTIAVLALLTSCTEAQHQADHQKCTEYGLKKGTAAYAECRIKIEAARAEEEREVQEKKTKFQISPEDLAIMQAGANGQDKDLSELMLMHKNPEGYRQYKLQKTLDELQKSLEETGKR